MAGIVWNYDPSAPEIEPSPATPAEAIGLLDRGNATFAELEATSTAPLIVPVDADDMGFGARPGEAPRQTPFAALLGCADARVPLELIFLQSANDLFVVRVAGNVLGAECIGSIDYAVENLASVRLLAVLGHTRCGAVTGSVDAYLATSIYLSLSANLPVRAIVDAIMPSVRAADIGLQEAHGPEATKLPGYRSALIDTAVILNAAVGAEALERIFAANLGRRRGVAMGVYDLASRTVGMPAAGGQSGPHWKAGLISPPRPEDFPEFVMSVARSRHVTNLLDAPPRPLRRRGTSGRA